MKKLFVFTAFWVFCLGFSQNTDYADRMEHIFGNIDKTKVTTGYLKEFGIRFNEMEVYNGVLDTINWTDKTQWHSLYSSLYTMRVGTAAASMTAPGTVANYLKTQSSSATLYDFNGNQVGYISPASGSMNTESLPSGQYILVIQYGSQSETHHIIIQ